MENEYFVKKIESYEWMACYGNRLLAGEPVSIKAIRDVVGAYCHIPGAGYRIPVYGSRYLEQSKVKTEKHRICVVSTGGSVTWFTDHDHATAMLDYYACTGIMARCTDSGYEMVDTPPRRRRSPAQRFAAADWFGF